MLRRQHIFSSNLSSDSDMYDLNELSGDKDLNDFTED